MSIGQKSSSIEQMCAEEKIFSLVEKALNVPLEKNPKLVLHGHLHTSNHSREILGLSDVYNTSLVNEQYEPVFKPLYLFV